MSKITRFTQKLFGTNAGSGQIAEFGSAAASGFSGGTTYSGATATPALVQGLSNWLSGWFDAVDGLYNPAIEDMNAVHWLFAYQLSYLFQEGVPEWDAGTTYYIGSVAQDGTGTLYVSLTDGNLNNVVTDTANWKGLLPVANLTSYFGSGVDGDLTVSSGTTTLTRDMYYNNVTISGTAKVNTAGYRMYVAGTLDLTNAPAGAISFLAATADGGNGTNASAGTPGTGGAAGGAMAGGVVGGGTTGIAGANGVAGINTGTNGTTGVSNSIANGGSGGAGGAGGHSGAGTGGPKGTSSGAFLVSAYAKELIKNGTGTIQAGCSGGGGGSGAVTQVSNSSGGAGGSGSGSGVLYLAANIISRGVSTAAGAIASLGGKGGNAGTSTAAAGTGGSGGGGAGGGGWVYLLVGRLIGTVVTNLVDASGGVGGTASTGPGGDGTGGNGGDGGRITAIELGAGTVSETTGSAGGAGSGTTGGTAGACKISL